jgi:hypothetical protein
MEQSFPPLGSVFPLQTRPGYDHLIGLSKAVRFGLGPWQDFSITSRRGARIESATLARGVTNFVSSELRSRDLCHCWLRIVAGF